MGLACLPEGSTYRRMPRSGIPQELSLPQEVSSATRRRPRGARGSRRRDLGRVSASHLFLETIQHERIQLDLASHWLWLVDDLEKVRTRQRLSRLTPRFVIGGVAAVMQDDRARRIFITVAEVSGDRHAAQLVRSLKAMDPTLVVEGLGGPAVQAAGAIVHHETVTKAAMGWRGALRALEVARLLRWTKAWFDDAAHRPDLWIGVDSPSMNFHFAKAAHGRGIPTLQYVAPQLWAWREGRMKKVRAWVDHLACILPFEEAYFRRHGVRATFVGHPLFDELPAAREIPGPGFPQRPPTVGLLPGSRASEAAANFPRMLEVATILRKEFPQTSFLVPTVAATHPVIAQHVRDWAQRSDATFSPEATEESGEVKDKAGGSLHYARDAFDEMAPRCDMCITASGTATLHVAGFGVPMIVVYAGNRALWNLLGRWLVRIRTFALVNLLAESDPTNPDASRHIVPEFMPWYGPVKPVADAALDFLRHPEQLAAQRTALGRLIGTLDRPGASDNVAKLALKMSGATEDEKGSTAVSADTL